MITVRIQSTALSKDTNISLIQLQRRESYIEIYRRTWLTWDVAGTVTEYQQWENRNH